MCIWENFYGMYNLKVTLSFGFWNYFGNLSYVFLMLYISFGGEGFQKQKSMWMRMTLAQLPSNQLMILAPWTNSLWFVHPPIFWVSMSSLRYGKRKLVTHSRKVTYLSLHCESNWMVRNSKPFVHHLCTNEAICCEKTNFYKLKVWLEGLLLQFHHMHEEIGLWFGLIMLKLNRDLVWFVWCRTPFPKSDLSCYLILHLCGGRWVIWVGTGGCTSNWIVPRLWVQNSFFSSWQICIGFYLWEQFHPSWYFSWWWRVWRNASYI